MDRIRNRGMNSGQRPVSVCFMRVKRLALCKKMSNFVALEIETLTKKK